MQLADTMRAPCYVDASPAGEPLYRKRGFGEMVGELRLDLGEFDGDGEREGEGFGVQRWVALRRGVV